MRKTLILNWLAIRLGILGKAALTGEVCCSNNTYAWRYIFFATHDRNSAQADFCVNDFQFSREGRRSVQRLCLCEAFPHIWQTAGTAYWDNFTLLKKQSGAALIVNGTIEANQLKLGTASLSSDEDGALVLGDIQSDTYESGVSGWSIKRDGSAEFNEVVISRNS
jgi:hypothetical protein